MIAFPVSMSVKECYNVQNMEQISSEDDNKLAKYVIFFHKDHVAIESKLLLSF